VQAIERALARTGARLDRALGRAGDAEATIDLDATQIEVHGAKAGAARSRHGALSYAPHARVCRGRERGSLRRTRRRPERARRVPTTGSGRCPL